jgi:hypothetical protein
MSRRNWLLAGLGLIVAVAVVAVALAAGGDDEASETSAPVAAKEGNKGEDGAGGGGGRDGNAVSGEAANDTAGTAGGGASEAEGGAGGGSAGSGGASGDGPNGGAGEAGLNGSTAKGRSGKKGGSRKRGSKGGGGEGSATGADAAFFAQADAICKELRADTLRRLGDYTGSGLESLAKNAPRVVNELVIPNLEEQMDRIQALNPPSSASGAVAALFDSIEAMITAGQADPKEFLLGTSAELATKSEAIGKKNGFSACGGI